MIPFGATRTVDPTEDPVSLSEAKDHLRITDDDEDADISDKLLEAIRFVEEQTHRQLVRATYEITFDRFPVGRERQKLPLSPLSSVDQIDYTDADGDAQTINSGTIASDYVVTTNREPGYITPAFGVVWPIARDEPDAVTYTIKCGWADAASVDRLAKAAIKLILGHLYENREETTAVALKTIPIGAVNLLNMLIYDDFQDYEPPT